MHDRFCSRGKALDRPRSEGDGDTTCDGTAHAIFFLMRGTRGIPRGAMRSDDVRESQGESGRLAEGRLAPGARQGQVRALGSGREDLDARGAAGDTCRLSASP